MKSTLALCAIACACLFSGLAGAASSSSATDSLSMKDIAASNEKLPDYKALHQLVANRQKPILWLFVGDSITHGAMHTSGYRCYPELWQEIMKWEPRQPGNFRRTDDIIVNSAVSGETATGFLQHLDWRFKPFKPQVVFINFGINDAGKANDTSRFRADLTQIVKLVRGAKAIPVLQVPTPTMGRKSNRAEFAQAVRDVAAKEKVLLVDHLSYWKEVSGQEECPKEWMNNAVHPNYMGHRLMARALAFELGFWANSPTLKLPIK